MIIRASSDQSPVLRMFYKSDVQYSTFIKTQIQLRERYVSFVLDIII